MSAGKQRRAIPAFHAKSCPAAPAASWGGMVPLSVDGRISVTVAALRKTALHSTHRRLGAKMVDFGGWDMPVEYAGITQEHMAVRTGVGVF